MIGMCSFAFDYRCELKENGTPLGQVEGSPQKVLTSAGRWALHPVCMRTPIPLFTEALPGHVQGRPQACVVEPC